MKTSFIHSDCKKKKQWQKRRRRRRRRREMKPDAKEVQHLRLPDWKIDMAMNRDRACRTRERIFKRMFAGGPTGA